MNEKYNQIIDDGKFISIPGLCIYLLKKWKLMLIVALVAAIAAGGMSYVTSKQAYQAAQNSTGVLKEPAISDYDKEVVYTKMDMIETCEKAIEEYTYYYANSIKVNLNPNDISQATVAYTLSGVSTEEVMKAFTLCELMIMQDESLLELSEKMSVHSDPAMIREVSELSVTYMEDTAATGGAGYNYSAQVKVVARHYNKDDAKIMLEFFEEQLKECAAALAPNNISATLSYVSSEVATCCDRSLAPLGRDVRTGELSCYETISNLKKNMSEEQLAYYNYLEKVKDNEANGTQAVTAQKPTVNVVLAVIAAVAGAACVAALYAAFYLFGGRVNNADELKSWLAVPVIEAQSGADMVAAILEGIAAKSGAKRIYLTGSAGELNSGFLAELKNVLAAKGVEAVVGSSLLKDAKAFQEAAECGAVVLLEKCNVSKEKDLREAVVKASSCDMKVLGIVLEK